MKKMVTGTICYVLKNQYVKRLAVWKMYRNAVYFCSNFLFPFVVVTSFFHLFFDAEGVVQLAFLFVNPREERKLQLIKKRATAL
jgi:hypothetical protein